MSSPNRPVQVDVDFLIAVYRSAIDNSSALYCSAPITSGRRFVEWVRARGNDIRDVDHAASEHADEHRERVVKPNLEHASAVVRKLRELSPIPVIDPTVVPHVASWSQRDWLHFWERVISRFVVGLVLADDWQYSFGCAHEFGFAQANGIATFDEAGSVIALERGRGLIESAIADIRAVGGSTARLESALAIDVPVPACASPRGRGSLADFLCAQRQDAS